MSLPVETSKLAVRLIRKDQTRHVAHVTVPYDHNGARKLYVKVALTANWLRRVFADRPFSVRRARDVANATEIMSDLATVSRAVSIIEEMCRFNEHDATSVRQYPSACVFDLAAQAPLGFDFLCDTDTNDGAMFAVSAGRITYTKVHVYNTENEPQRVVVFGAESDVQNALAALVVMVERVNDGEGHAAARNWALQYLKSLYTDDDDAGGGIDEIVGDDDDDFSAIGKPNVKLRCEREVTSWLDEKERRAASGVASYASIVQVGGYATPHTTHHQSPPSSPSIPSPLPPSSPSIPSPRPQSIPPTAGKEDPELSICAPVFAATPAIAATPAFAATPVFAATPWAPPAMALPWAGSAAAVAAVMLCRGCGVYPRRVAFLPCSHLALCLLCNDLTKKSNAPCVVCGAHVKERLIFYLD